MGGNGNVAKEHRMTYFRCKRHLLLLGGQSMLPARCDFLSCSLEGISFGLKARQGIVKTKKGRVKASQGKWWLVCDPDAG